MTRRRASRVVDRAARRRIGAWLGAIVLLESSAAATLRAASPHAPSALPAVARQAWLDANHLSLPVSNVGSYALNLDNYDSGLEYPKGSGKPLVFAAGPWLAGKVGPDIRTAIAEFGWEFTPGPIVGGTYHTDTLRYKVYKVSRSDTTGWGEWVERAGPMGAPLDGSGTRPGFVGDQMLWTVFNDANPVPEVGLRYGQRLTPPMWLEVQLLAYAFNRPGPLRDAVFLHYRIVHKGVSDLDSFYVGLFMDGKTSAVPILAACDVTRDLGYVYRSDDDDFYYGAAGPAVGLDLLRGPLDAGGAPIPATSFVVYPNGADPSDSLQFYNILRGALPWGATMVDSSTMQPTRFWSSGDPVTGTGWNATMPPHPHWALASGPFQLAPGDTQEVDVALVVGQGADRLASVTALRANDDVAQALFDASFASVPAPEILPLRAWPSPAGATVHIGYSIAGQEALVEATVYDLGGRRIRRLMRGTQLPGDHTLTWEGTDDHGRRARQGLYLVRVAIASQTGVARVALLR